MRHPFAAAAVGFLLATPLMGQNRSLVVSLAPTFPTGAYGVYAKTGWLAAVGVRLGVGQGGGWVGGELVYGRNSHSDIAGDKTSIPGLFGEAGYKFGTQGRARPFLRGGLGVLNHQYGTNFTGAGSYGQSDWGVALTAGGGVEIPVGRMAIQVEARYVARSETTFIPLMAGLSIPLGR